MKTIPQKPTIGTPKTLTESIDNGLKASTSCTNRIDRAKVITTHVRDYLAQWFGSAMMEAELENSQEPIETLDLLFQRIASGQPNNDSKRVILVAVDAETYALLGTIDRPEKALASLASHAADGVRRPGAWERGWIEQCFGELAERPRP